MQQPAGHLPLELVSAFQTYVLSFRKHCRAEGSNLLRRPQRVPQEVPKVRHLRAVAFRQLRGSLWNHLCHLLPHTCPLHRSHPPFSLPHTGPLHFSHPPLCPLLQYLPQYRRRRCLLHRQCQPSYNSLPSNTWRALTRRSLLSCTTSWRNHSHSQAPRRRVAWK